MQGTKTGKLIGTGRNGDAIHQSQQMGTRDGEFKKVSRKWLSKCLSYEQAIGALAEGHAQTEDILATTVQMQPTVNDKGQFAIRHEDGREFRPTRYAVTHLADWSKCGTWFASSLLDSPADNKGRQLFARDREDAETLVQVLKNGFRRIDPNKQFMWRTRQDGTLRAMLTDQYAIINNEWFMESLKKLIPGGLCSHWRGDCDSIFGNVLIPDTIREEKDSDYGGMLSISNSEIGERELYTLPSVFRAICQNGCIWDQKVGEELRVRHRGSVNLDELLVRMKANLDEQIPLLPQGIDKLLGIRTFGWDGDSVLPLFAQVARQHRLTKRQATGLLDAYNVERAESPDLARTLFGVVNSITRAGQKMSNAEWVRLDSLGGELVNYERDDWARLVSRAKSLKKKEVEEAFASLAS